VVYDRHDRWRLAIGQMTSNPHIFTGDGFAHRLALLYAALFLTLGIQVPFLPVWLAAKGMDAHMIGIVLAVPMVVRVFAIPMAARIADQRDALRAVIVVAAMAAVVGYGALALVDGVVAILVAFAFASAASTPVMLLTDAYALRGLVARGLAYGAVRLWGSAAFIVASLAAGALFDLIAPRDLIWLIVAPVVLTAGAAGLLAPLEGQGRRTTVGAPPPAAQVLRAPVFLLVAGAASLVQASHAVYYGFSTIAWQQQGFDGIAIGALWSLGVVAEIVLFAASARLPAGVTPTLLLCLGAAGASLRWAAMAWDPPAVALPVLQCLHALSFGATHLGALGFVARAAPPGLATTAQGYLAVALGVVMAVAMGLAGILYARYGGQAYTAMAMMALAGGLCAVKAHRITSR
jgi:PPP family 3-phenylpropionic acid transporter